MRTPKYNTSSAKAETTCTSVGLLLIECIESTDRDAVLHQDCSCSTTYPASTHTIDVALPIFNPRLVGSARDFTWNTNLLLHPILCQALRSIRPVLGKSLLGWASLVRRSYLLSPDNLMRRAGA